LRLADFDALVSGALTLRALIPDDLMHDALMFSALMFDAVMFNALMSDAVMFNALGSPSSHCYKGGPGGIAAGPDPEFWHG
jgi:hypothetical protein